jgi:undecaprenyl-diphosphatase
MVSRILDAAGSLAGPWAYVAVGLLAAGESSIGVGLVVPGETGMIVGGFVVSQGNATYALMLAVAIAGAILGDSVGYEIGRRLGPRVRGTRIGSRIGDDRWMQAEAYLAARGGRAIFFARFVAVVRSLVPAVAGIIGMPYRRFLLFNALGGIVWATIYVSIGYFAGRSWERFADTIEGAGYVVLVLVVVVVVVAVTGRWAARNQESARAALGRVGAWGPVGWVRRTFPGPMRFVERRFRLGDPLGLSLTVGLVFLILTGWAFGVVLADVLLGADLVRVDNPVTTYVVDHREPWLTTLMRAATWVGSPLMLAVIVVVTGLAWMVAQRRWGVFLFLGIVLGGAVVLSAVVAGLVSRERPPSSVWLVAASGSSFPSGHATQVTAVLGAMAYLHGAVVRAWPRRVAIWVGALLLVPLAGFSRTYLGVNWSTDVLGGHALGAMWLAVAVMAFGASTRYHRRQSTRPRIRRGGAAATDLGGPPDHTTNVSSRTA